MFNNKNRQKMQRILAIIMAVVMFLSLFGTIFYYLALPTFAADTTEDKLIRVGLMYGNNITVGFETDAPYGFFLARVNHQGDLTHDVIWELDETKVSCIVDGNLSKSAMTYSNTSSTENTVIGGYHAELAYTYDSFEEAAETVAILVPMLKEVSLYPIPAFIDGSYRIRAGHFASADAAEACAETLTELVEAEWYEVSPTSTAVALVDPLTDKLLFEYDCNDETALGLTARSSETGEKGYLITPAQKLYAGVFTFRRYQSDQVNGVSLTDIIPLEQYVKGVLPYEIYPQWGYEAQCAFAICVRSYTLSHLNTHSKYGVDLCNTGHCQVYGGATRITDNVERIVDDTRGIVMVSNGEYVNAFYSSSVGDTTVSAYDAWGFTHIPYLVAVPTPWERFPLYTNGSWQSEVSPTVLLDYLKNTKGHTNLRGQIESITIDQFAENSSYVRQLTLTDTYGTKVTLQATENVRNGLSAYLKSANFVVGKGSVEAPITTVTSTTPDTLQILDGSKLPKTGAATMQVMTAEGKTLLDTATGSAVTGNGVRSIVGTAITTETQTVKASSPNNFIFVGKGWGHGVGISQYGIRDLELLGYKAEEILRKYFTGIEFVDCNSIN